jgi:hypothetical protein
MSKQRDIADTRLRTMERHYHMLLIRLWELGILTPGVDICVDTRCQVGPGPHMAEQPGLCPILKQRDLPTE